MNSVMVYALGYMEPPAYSYSGSQQYLDDLAAQDMTLLMEIRRQHLEAGHYDAIAYDVNVYRVAVPEPSGLLWFCFSS